MQSTRWTSGCPRVNLALAWCCVPSEAARRATIIIKGEEADADGSARLGQLLRCPFAGLLQRSQCWRHKEQRRAKDALARRCVVGCGLGKGGLRVCNVLGVCTVSFRRNRQWGAAPFTLPPSLTFLQHGNVEFTHPLGAVNVTSARPLFLI